MKGLGVEFDIKFVVFGIVGIVDKIGGAQKKWNSGELNAIIRDNVLALGES